MLVSKDSCKGVLHVDMRRCTTLRYKGVKHTGIQVWNTPVYGHSTRHYPGKQHAAIQAFLTPVYGFTTGDKQQNWRQVSEHLFYRANCHVLRVLTG